jgi:hypothetical protein
MKNMFLPIVLLLALSGHPVSDEGFFCGCAAVVLFMVSISIGFLAIKPAANTAPLAIMNTAPTSGNTL